MLSLNLRISKSLLDFPPIFPPASGRVGSGHALSMVSHGESERLKFINDDYCDLSDGSDEFETSACSSHHVMYSCTSSHHIFTSRLGDGDYTDT